MFILIPPPGEMHAKIGSYLENKCLKLIYIDNRIMWISSCFMDGLASYIHCPITIFDSIIPKKA